METDRAEARSHIELETGTHARRGSRRISRAVRLMRAAACPGRGRLRHRYSVLGLRRGEQHFKSQLQTEAFLPS